MTAIVFQFKIILINYMTACYPCKKNYFPGVFVYIGTIHIVCLVPNIYTYMYTFIFSSKIFPYIYQTYLHCFSIVDFLKSAAETVLVSKAFYCEKEIENTVW